MRNLIYGISILCLALAGFITVKALNLPEKKIQKPESQLVTKTQLHPERVKKAGPAPFGEQDLSPFLNEKIKKVLSPLEQKLSSEIANSQTAIRTLEDTIKQLERKLQEKNKAFRTDTETAENSIAKLEQKLTGKIDVSQTNIQALEDTIKQLRKELKDKNKISPAKGSADIKTAQPERSPVSPINRSQSLMDIVKSENTENALELLLVDVGFSSGKFVIGDKTASLIKQAAQYILFLPPRFHLIIEGHTDNVPVEKSSGKKYPYKNNKDLSLFRATAVAKMFEKEGISADRISTVGYGAEHPIASNKTVDGRAKNRRVVVRIIPEERKH